MNFVGHLYIARRFDPDLDFGLGAMLPDFAGMARVRLAACDDESVRAGIALHHATDDVFHALPSFTSLTTRTFEGLLARGTARGPARAVAHIGVEMLLDGELLRDEALGSAFIATVERLRRHQGALARDREGGERLALLTDRLVAHGVPHEYRNTEAVVSRLRRVLSLRPRLALDPVATEASLGVLPEIQVLVRQCAREIVTAVADALPNDAVLVR